MTLKLFLAAICYAIGVMLSFTMFAVLAGNRPWRAFLILPFSIAFLALSTILW